ncbi:MAG: protoporphyrinogen/coproporphyrinogen oxidase [Sciscionella sp.]
MPSDVDVAVVGAGVAGLSAACLLRDAGLSVRVFESGHRVGGRMASFRHQGYTIDEGAEQIPTYGYGATWKMLRELGIPLDDVPLIGRSIGMWRNGRAHAGVSDPRGLLSGAGLSARARLDLVRFMAFAYRRRHEFDPDHPDRSPLGARTIAGFANRYHRDLHDYLFQPVAGGFFGWDTRVSTASPFVSLLLAVGTVPSWRTYRDGMDTFARAMAERVDVSTGSAVRQVVAERDSARVFFDRGTVTARSVLLCVPAPEAARLYGNPPPEELEFLSACAFTPMLKVSCLLDRPLAPACHRKLYALLVPEVEDLELAGVIVDHAKHPGRAPAGRGLLSLLAAPSVIPELLDMPDAEVVTRLTARAEHYLPGLARATTANFVHRFRNGLPAATPEALRLHAGFLRRGDGPVDYAGDWVTLRPSSEGAVRAAVVAASRILARRGSAQRPRQRKEAV